MPDFGTGPVTYHLTVTSVLPVPTEEVWAHASSMRGVNAELWPIHMSHPKRRFLEASVPLGIVLFRSVITLFRVIPLDVHALRLLAIAPGESFHEDSSSWTEARWVHKRRLAPEGNGTRITDLVTFTPRYLFLAPILAATVRRTFARRHAYLRKRFGGTGDALTFERR